MNIRPIINSTLNKVSNSKFIEKLSAVRAGDAAATIAIVSNTTKDLVNFIYYTKQVFCQNKTASLAALLLTLQIEFFRFFR